MSTAQAADAPPCNMDGALPLFTLSRCSQGDESALCRYFTHTTRLCSFLCQLCSPSSHFVVFLLFFSMFFACLLVVFTLFLRSSPFENSLSFDKLAVYLTSNQYQNEGRTKAERRQKGGRRAPGPLHSLWASLRFCKYFCQSGLRCKGSAPRLRGVERKRPIWGTAENCGILRGAIMLFAKSGLQW